MLHLAHHLLRLFKFECQAFAIINKFLALGDL
jgi:hypothetical protein